MRKSGITPKTGNANTSSICSLVLKVLSINSNRKLNPTLIINPNKNAIAVFVFLFGPTGFSGIFTLYIIFTLPFGISSVDDFINSVVTESNISLANTLSVFVYLISKI